MNRPLALVTGASKGIGQSLAQELARHGYDLFLVARNPEELAQVSLSLSARFSVHAEWMAVDLSVTEQQKQIIEHVKSRFSERLRILVNNAGYGLWGWFHELDVDEQMRMMHVNVHAPLVLTHALLPILARNGPSHILNISSSTAYQALPTMTVYAASKSFLVQFSRGLRQECRRLRWPVTVTCVSPGSTRTHFIERAKMEPLRQMADRFGMDPEQVARIAIQAMFRGKAEVVPGTLNKVGTTLARYLPKGLVENAAANIYVNKLKKG